MTPDEIETRITRLETRQTILAALVDSVLPATLPAARHQVLAQFRQFCTATEAQIFRDDVPAWLADWQLAELAESYQKLQTAIQLIDAHEQKRS